MHHLILFYHYAQITEYTPWSVTTQELEVATTENA